jgi:hypothetical protein
MSLYELFSTIHYIIVNELNDEDTKIFLCDYVIQEIKEIIQEYLVFKNNMITYEINYINNRYHSVSFIEYYIPLFDIKLYPTNEEYNLVTDLENMRNCEGLLIIKLLEEYYNLFFKLKDGLFFFKLNNELEVRDEEYYDMVKIRIRNSANL